MQPMTDRNAWFVVAEGKANALPVPTRIPLPATGYRLLPDQFQ